METKERYGDKLFIQDHSDEMYRLELVSKTYDFISQQQLRTLPLKPDAHCLDVGCGSGSMAEWLSQQPNLRNGEIIALDRYVKLLTERLQPANNLKILQYDIVQDIEPIGQFDLVNVRFVLMHLRERVDLLKKIASWVKPGGWLVVSDIIDIPIEISGNLLYHRVMSTMWDVLIGFIGTDKDWSHSLSSRFNLLGFDNIRTEVYLPPISKGSPMSEFWYLTWKDLHDRLIEMSDLSDDELTEAENNLIEGNVTALSPGMLTCIGQKL